MKAKRPHPIDIYVGSRVKMRRMLIGMSQEKLGEQLGLTFQQVQKYEKGSNRIGASRLWHLAQILDVPVRYFFEGLQEGEARSRDRAFADRAQQKYMLDFVQSSESIQLVKAFTGIKNARTRRALVNLVKALAEKD